MSRYTSIRSGASALPEQSVAHLTHDLIYQSGVVNLTDNHWKVSENNPQGMSVLIADGRGYFKKTAMTYHGYTDTEAQTSNKEVVTIDPNNDSNLRISAVVAYLDLSATPNANGSGVLTFAEVKGSSALSPTPPTDNEIQTEIGSGNPFLRLANIEVTAGATSIVNAKITDTRIAAYIKMAAGIYESLLMKSKMGGNYQQVRSLSGTGTINLDCALYNVFEVTKTGNITLTLSNMQIGQYIQIDLIEDATGSRTTTWFSGIKWPDNVVPTETANANKRDSFVIKKIGDSSYIGYIAGQNL